MQMEFFCACVRGGMRVCVCATSVIVLYHVCLISSSSQILHHFNGIGCRTFMYQLLIVTDV